jgi:hypothetical protein
MFCNYCHPRYNTSADCGACYDGADRRFVLYPRCDNILYVTGNISVPLRDSSMLHALVRDDYFHAIAVDMTTFLNDTLRCHLWSHNITAYVIAWQGGNNFTIDVELLDHDAANNTIAGQCVVDGLLHNIQDMAFTASSNIVERLSGGGGATSGATNAHSYFDLSQTRMWLANNDSATPLNPCEPYWCYTIPPVRDPEETNLTWLIAVCSLLGVSVLTAAAVYFIWHRPREQFRRDYRYRRGADADFRRVRDLVGLEVEWCSMHADGGGMDVSKFGGAEEEPVELTGKATQQQFTPDPEQPPPSNPSDAEQASSSPPETLKEEVVDFKKEMFDSI